MQTTPRQHVFLVGSSGSGKTNALPNLFLGGAISKFYDASPIKNFYKATNPPTLIKATPFVPMTSMVGIVQYSSS